MLAAWIKIVSKHLKFLRKLAKLQDRLHNLRSYAVFEIEDYHAKKQIAPDAIIFQIKQI